MKRKNEEVIEEEPGLKRRKLFNMENSSPTIIKIRIYPIKSCRSFEVKSIDLINGNLKFDREYLIYDLSKDVVLSQKNESNLTQIQPKVDVKTGLLSIVIKDKELELEEPESPIVRIIKFRETEHLPVSDMGESVSSFLSLFLGRKVCLCKMRKGRSVENSINNDRCDEKINFNQSRETGIKVKDSLVKNELNFGNRCSVCVLSMETVDFFNDNEEGVKIAEENYRANIIVKSGSGKPFQEDEWKRWGIEGQEMEFRYVRGAPRRCPMTSIDQSEGYRDDKIMEILCKKRGKDGKYPDVGALVCSERGKSDGKISVGDKIKILSE